MRSGKQEHETDSKRLAAQGEQDARALTVTGTVRVSFGPDACDAQTDALLHAAARLSPGTR